MSPELGLPRANEPHNMRIVYEEWAILRAMRDAALAIHRPVNDHGNTVCDADFFHDWPCRTAQALGITDR